MKENSFLGRGWNFPPTFSKVNRQVKMVEEMEDILQSLQILLSTPIGESLLHPEYGCTLQQYVFNSLDQETLTQMKEAVANAILKHEPRITVDQIRLQKSSKQAGLLYITVEFTVRGTNTRSNLVYPFHIKEATIAPQNF